MAGKRSLVECFAEVDDPRIERTRVHPQESTVVVLAEEEHHGRIEKRFYYQSAIPKKLEHLTADWAEARSICQAVSCVPPKPNYSWLRCGCPLVSPREAAI
ncbi:MAG: hypothetical protein ACTHOU_05580 [Aureliella sp.]